MKDECSSSCPLEAKWSHALHRNTMNNSWDTRRDISHSVLSTLLVDHTSKTGWVCLCRSLAKWVSAGTWPSSGRLKGQMKINFRPCLICPFQKKSCHPSSVPKNSVLHLQNGRLSGTELTWLPVLTWKQQILECLAKSLTWRVFVWWRQVPHRYMKWCAKCNMMTWWWNAAATS